MAFWSETCAALLRTPVVLEGDLNLPGLGLSQVDLNWLARNCRSVVHAAARVSMSRSLDGEPWKTNVEGARRLVELCGNLGIGHLHHVSTAFVCGDAIGAIYEHELDRGQSFHNDYEKSKFEAEKLVRKVGSLQTTIYRPSVLVGDSRTGYTSSYHGFYRFLELADRLAEHPWKNRARSHPGRRQLSLRLPYTGDEPRNLVPVDWVSQAIVEIVNHPPWHGRTYHLVSREPVWAGEIKEVAEEVLEIEGVEWGGSSNIHCPNQVEEVFLEHLRDYWPYLHGDPAFACRNTLEALPYLPAPRVDRAMLTRLIRFAVADHWGRSSRASARSRVKFPCGHYLEAFLPDAARHSSLAHLSLEISIGLVVHGPGGGQWSCLWNEGDLRVQRGLTPGIAVVYRTDTSTFAAIVRGRLSPQDAFFSQQVEIEGEVEKALKLAVLFGQLVQECPYEPQRKMEAGHAASLLP
jgi:nucleoside-diphosphate-sugar epimerase